MSAVEQKQEVACTLQDGQQVTRRQRWLNLADRALIAKTATERGVCLTYRPGPGVVDELRELARLETECCAFASWQVTSREDELRLEVSAAGEAAQAVWAMFEEAPPAKAVR